MIRGCFIKRRGQWQSPAHDLIDLDYQDRCRRRLVMRARGGTQFLLDLERPAYMGDGDAIVLDDGRHIGVIAAPEAIAELRPGRGLSLAEIAYHIGNRHLETQIFDNRICIRQDHVIEAMILGMGGSVRHLMTPFDPLRGAYDSAHHKNIQL